jgi:hypothetical protein
MAAMQLGCVADEAPVAKWLTRWSAKPVFMGSNPIRCSKNQSFTEKVESRSNPE